MHGPATAKVPKMELQKLAKMELAKKTSEKRVVRRRTPHCCRKFRYSSGFVMPNDENDLFRAEELVAEARRYVQEQKGRIVRFNAAGVDTANAERTLRMFESNLRRFEEHRDILKKPR